MWCAEARRRLVGATTKAWIGAPEYAKHWVWGRVSSSPLLLHAKKHNKRQKLNVVRSMQ